MVEEVVVVGDNGCRVEEILTIHITVQKCQGRLKRHLREFKISRLREGVGRGWKGMGGDFFRGNLNNIMLEIYLHL